MRKNGYAILLDYYNNKIIFRELMREQKEALDKAVAEKDSILAKKDAYIKQLEEKLGIATA